MSIAIRMVAERGPEEQPRLARPFQLCIFDETRGSKEGQEADKILGYYPNNIPVQEQTAVVGLVQAISTFAATFAADAPCSVLNMEHSRWTVHSFEPHIWLLLITEKDWHRGPVREAGLQATLRQLYHLVSLIHGPIQQLLNRDPSASTARQAIAGELCQFGDRLTRRRGSEYSALHNPLTSLEASPMLHLPQLVFLGMQSLVNRVLVSPSWNGAPVTGVMLLHEHWLLWSTLPLADTSTLYQLCSWALIPAVKAATHSSFGRRLTGSSTPTREMQSAGGKRHSLLNQAAWQLLPDGLLLLSGSPPEQASSGPETILHTPSLWLQGSQEWCSLLVLRVAEQLLLVLLPEDSPATQSAAEGCICIAEPLMKTLAKDVAQHLNAVRRLHIPTFRYLFTDDLLMAVQASPGSKIGTLSRSSLALVNSVRADLEAQLCDGQGFAEVAVWGQHDCWVVAKCQGPRRLYVVLEQQGKEGLLDACNAADHFAKTHFPGMFE